ncbi:MAG TPA: hypothetical protein VFB73_17730 [Chloroflexota bacterium]|nr:hypothetical protein [Chloroflexota bacterium]
MSASSPMNFTYAYYRQMLAAMKANFHCHRLVDAERVLQAPRARPVLFLRHDIDIDPFRALPMAELEAAAGIQATYMVMTNTPLYRVDDPSCRAALLTLAAMGHEIGLHFDFDHEAERHTPPDPATLERRILAACDQLQQSLGIPIASVSFHRPIPALLHGPLRLAGKINAYAQELMAWYLSDSGGRWRDGEPLPRLRQPDRPILQLLVHPIWWGESYRPAAIIIRTVFDTLRRTCAPEHLSAIDAALAVHLGVPSLLTTPPAGQGTLTSSA